MKAILSAILLVVLFVTALAVGAQNEQLVHVNYLIAESELRLSWLMAGLFLLGFVSCFVFVSAFYAKNRFEVGSLRRKTAKQHKQLMKLQNELGKD